MGRVLKGAGHLVAGSLLAAALIALAVALPSETAAVLVPAMALFANTAILLYLLEETHRDLGRFGSRFGEVRSASPIAGLLIGLLPLALLVGALALSPRM